MIPAAARAEAEETLARWGTPLGEEGWARLDLYLRDVLEYGRKTNLTAALDTGELLRRHALDALAALGPLRRRLGDAPRLLDLGCGAGFVGICLQIAWPQARVTLVESVYRKVCFLHWTRAHLKLANLQVVHGRSAGGMVHRLGAGGGRQASATDAPADGADAVLARALAKFPEAAALAAPLARRGGTVALHQSRPPDPEDPPTREALQAAGLALEEGFAYTLPGETVARHVVLLRRTE
ncbi:MAG: hypothetical protein A2X36_04710 [Elusimicrobia bacterium GWA2_69_24]|nr:MAG: hypothetical protein A2X36_04710 [Elusimicrobia bacterium GWA2_69_24]HBL17529.1 hypothetical protein [Elusimicrobiota bacterium]